MYTLLSEATATAFNLGCQAQCSAFFAKSILATRCLVFSLDLRLKLNIRWCLDFFTCSLVAWMVSEDFDDA